LLLFEAQVSLLTKLYAQATKPRDIAEQHRE
jgi:hypothetical protein